jgi:hypothetical protein
MIFKVTIFYLYGEALVPPLTREREWERFAGSNPEKYKT